jgi:predicted  nucleic acid-binding Zn-ribbon protein
VFLKINKYINMKFNTQNILLLIVIILIAWNILNTNSIKTDVKGYKEKIEALQTKVDSAQAVNEKIDIKIDSVKNNVVNITKEIHHIDNNISVIKQQTNEKVNIVDTYTASELEQFFTDRYDKGSN